MQKKFRYFRLSILSLLGALSLAGLQTSIASAHWADLAVADIVVENTAVRMTLTIPTMLVAFADENGDGQLSLPEFETQQSELTAFFGDRISLGHANEESAQFVLGSVPDKSAQSSSTSEAHSTFVLKYRWQEPSDSRWIRYDLFPSGTPTPQCLATISQGGTTRHVVFTPENTTLMLTNSLPWQQQFTSFLQLGIEHIFTGYDHILFLIALLLPGGRFLNLLKMVTAFTIAHSITLSLAAFELVAIPSALVESVIALSIVYVAVENLWRTKFLDREWNAFAFGLIHGLGFANILRELTNSQGSLVLSLASFNLGVELGQIAIVLTAFLGLKAIQKYAWVTHFRRYVSWVMIVMGCIWFAERAIVAM